MAMFLIKLKRCLRRSPRCFWLTLKQPVASSSQLFMAALGVLVLALTLRLASPEQRDMLATEWAIWIQAFLYAFLGWTVISILYAPFRAVADDRAKGRWHYRRRIYYERQLIGVAPFVAGGGDCAEIYFEDAEPNSLVAYHIDLDPPLPHASSYLERRPGEVYNLLSSLRSGGPRPSAGGRIGGRGKVRLDGNVAYLRVQLQADSVPVTARVFMTEFEITETPMTNLFDRLLKAMTQGEPHKAEKRAEKGATSPQRGVAKDEPPPQG